MIKPVRYTEWLLLLFTVSGSLVSFFSTNSQQQFSAVCAVLFCVSGLVSIIALPRAHVGYESKRFLPLLFSGAILTWAAVTSLASGRIMSAFMGEPSSLIGFYSMVIALCIITVSNERQDSLTRIVPYWALFLIVVQGVIALVQGPSGVDYGHGGFANSSALGFALVLMGPLLFIKNDTKSEEFNYARLIIALFTLIVAFVIQARFAFILLLVGYAWLFVGRARVSDAIKLHILCRGAVVLTGALAIIAWLGSKAIVGQNVLNIRLQLWNLASKAIMKNWLLGFGADGFFVGGASVSRFDMSQELPPLVFGDGSTDPHNLVLFIGVSFGIVGIVLASALVITWVFENLSPARISAASPVVVSLVGSTLLLLTMPITLDILPMYCVVIGLAGERSRNSFKRLNVVPLCFNKKDKFGSQSVRRLSVLAKIAAIMIILLALLNASSRVILGPVSYSRVTDSAHSSTLGRLWSFDPYFVYNSLTKVTYDASYKDDAPLNEYSAYRAQAKRLIELDRHNPYYYLAVAQYEWAMGSDVEVIETAYQNALNRYPAFPYAYAERSLFRAANSNYKGAEKDINAVLLYGDPEVWPWAELIETSRKTLDNRNK